MQRVILLLSILLNFVPSYGVTIRHPVDFTMRNLFYHILFELGQRPSVSSMQVNEQVHVLQLVCTRLSASSDTGSFVSFVDVGLHLQSTVLLTGERH